ncbi:MAG: ribose-phosphate pyrophosphokinase [Methylacidiphilales bacterium]|nr:ribose-phosphate pyrophosphokinase [Candidatus Methylacidiphilales bacterium]MDW8349206.1 ribose-phosphate pyrophosphokinase [Verrucomicrobiae bacterium]
MSRFNLPPQLFSGNANRPLAEAIARCLSVELGVVNVTTFPDGETFVKYHDNIRGRDLFILQPTSPPTNHNIMELLIMIDAARRASAARITAVIPFYGYARQDRKDQPRVPITAKLIANLLVAAGANRILAMDLHAQQIQGFFDIPVDHLYAAPVIYKYVQTLGLENLTVVSPDVGGMKMASYYSQMLHAGLALVVKRRTSATETEVQFVVGDVKGRDVLLVDDLTETAGTLTSAARVLKEHGARRIFAAVSHAILTDLAIERLMHSPIEELITTNSTPVKCPAGCNIRVLDVAPLLAEAIDRIHADQSISSLFEIKNSAS